MKRRTAGLAFIAISGLLLAGCAPSGTSGSEQASGDDVTLKVWSWRTEDVAAYNKIFDVFESENPGITIDFQAFQNTEYNQILTTGLAGSDGPDVPMVRSYGALQSWVDAGQLDPIDDDVAGLDAINPSVLAGAKGAKDGKIYSVPLATQTLQMYYNKDIFDKYGLSAPKTWDEFLSNNDTLVANGVTPMALGAKDAWVLPIFADIIGSARYGGSTFESEVLDGSKTFTDPDYVASLGLVQDMQKYLDPNVVGVSYTDSQVQFTAGQAAQFPGGSFELSTFTTQNPDLNLGTFQVPLPPSAVSSKPVTPAYADGNFGLNAKSTNKEASLKLLNWIATPEFGQLVADNLHQFSAIPGVTYDDPIMAGMWSAYEASPAPYLLLVNFRYGEPQGTALMGEGVQQMFLGQLDPAGLAQKVQDGISTWFTPKK